MFFFLIDGLMHGIVYVTILYLRHQCVPLKTDEARWF